MFTQLLALPFLLMAIDNDEDRQFAVELYYAYRGLFYKVAVRFFKQNIHEVEDAVSAAIEAMCTYLPSIRKIPASKMPAYMVSIIRHVCLRRLSKMNQEQSYTIRDDISELQDFLSADDDVEEIVFSKVTAEALLESYSRSLGEREKELIRMRHIDMMTFKEIAQVLHMKEGTVRTALSRAKQRLVAKASGGGEEQ